MDLNAAPRGRPDAIQRLAPRLRMANLFSLSEANFSRMIAELERNPLFQKYMYAEDPRLRLIAYRRFPRASLAASALPLSEDRLAGPESAIVQDFLERHQELIDLCRRVGADRFQRHFLHNQEGLSLAEIARDCGVTADEARRLLDLVNRAAALAGLTGDGPAAPGPAPGTVFSVLGRIEPGADGRLTLAYRNPAYGRGRYLIDADKLESLKKAGAFPPGEYRRLKKLLRSLEDANARKTSLHRAMELIMDGQAAYLASGIEEDLVDLRQLDLARRMGVHPSTVHRLAAGKAVERPDGACVPLKKLLGKGSVYSVKARIADLVAGEGELIQKGERHAPYQDRELRDLVNRALPSPIAARTVAKYRAELRIANVYERRRRYAAAKTSVRPAR